MGSLRTLHPKLVPIAQAFVRALEQSGLKVTVTSVYRSRRDQERLYRAYSEGRSRFPAARPGTSMHERAVAFDLHLVPPEYEAAGEAWEQLGLTWGGRFRDPIHFDFRARS